MKPQKKGDRPTVNESSGPTNRNDTQAAHENWCTIRALLCERIRRRAVALQRLSGANYNPRTIEECMAAVQNNGTKLWQLAERLDRQLDLAFAPRSRRLASTDAQPPSTQTHHPSEYKTKSV